MFIWPGDEIGKHSFLKRSRASFQIQVLVGSQLTLNTKIMCTNKNCIGGVITFDGQTGKPCKKCNPVRTTLFKQNNMESLISKAKELYKIAKIYDTVDELNDCFYKWMSFYYSHASLQNHSIEDDYIPLMNVIYHISYGTTLNIVDKEELAILNKIIN